MGLLLLAAVTHKICSNLCIRIDVKGEILLELNYDGKTFGETDPCIGIRWGLLKLCPAISLSGDIITFVNVPEVLSDIHIWQISPQSRHSVHFLYALGQWEIMLHCNVISLAGRIYKMIPEGTMIAAKYEHDT